MHRELRLRAAGAGLSLAEFLRREVSAIARRPSASSFLAQAERAASADVPTDAVVASIRADRDER